MLRITEYLKDNILITDGAMGTYYSEITGKPSADCVLGNINDPGIIENIHKDYIFAGAEIIRTNTFSANTVTLDRNLDFVKMVISEGCKIAKRASFGENVFIGASIGPIPDTDTETDNLREYFEIIDCFLKENIDIFIFETFYSLDYIKEIVSYIKEKNKDAFIVTQFSVNDIGVTKKSLNLDRIVSKINAFSEIDVIGFNCGVGPIHMLNILKKLRMPKGKIISVLPNAGYPEVIDNKVKYVMNPKYFAEVVKEMIFGNVGVVGGCCGTTPEHIRLLKDRVKKGSYKVSNTGNSLIFEKEKTVPVLRNDFHKKLETGEFIVAVELDPPFKASADKLIKGAKVLKENGVDIITFADSPMGKSRADSIIISNKIKREAGVEVLPHICCRDRNSVSLRSSVLGGYIEGIRNFLVITGDPVPGDIRGDVKSVFDLNSYSLINMINEMNNDIFEEDRVKVGGAVNFNVKNKDFEYKRLLRKAEAGAEFFLSQPIFTDETKDFIKSLPKDRKFKILGGIMPIVTYNNARFINNELPGITVPQKYAERFSPDMERAEAEAVGIEIAVEIAESIKDYVDGFYIITPFNRYEMVSKIIRRLFGKSD